MSELSSALLFYFFSQLSSGDASDSICPKGWGIGGNSGDGSYQKLIANNYGMNKVNNWLIQDYKEYNTINSDELVIQQLVSLIRSGYYAYNSGNYTLRTVDGDYWEIRANFDKSYALDFHNLVLRPQFPDGTRGAGRSVRCVAK